jgi:imidazolonepropionase-like amidohydrolase
MMKKLLMLLPALSLLISTSTMAFTQIQQSVKTKPLVFTHVTVIDATGAQAKPDMTVVVSDGHIVGLGKTVKVRLPKDAQVINATGKFLIPGLWDMHTHLSFYADTKEPPLTAFPELVANGVTGVRDLGGSFEQINKWRKESAEGAIIAPRIVQAGPFVDGPKEMSEFRAAQTVIVNNPEEARRAVTDLKRRGVDFIKVHNGVSREAYLALADECRKQKISLATHLPRSVRAAEASDAGTKSLEHIETLIESIVFDGVAPGGQPTKDPIAAIAEFTDEKAAGLFAKFSRNGTYFVPTLGSYRSFVQDAERLASTDAKYEPAAAGRKKLFQRFLQLVGLMQRSGVNVLSATDFADKSGGRRPDVRPGFSLHEELALFVEAGMTPMQALQTATLNPAKLLNISKTHGTIEKGKAADLVLLEANPLENIKNTQRIYAVVLNGRYLPKETLQKLLAEAEGETAKNSLSQ